MRVIAISPHEAKFCSVNTQTVKTGCRSVEFGPPFISLFDLVISLLEHFLSVPSWLSIPRGSVDYLRLSPLPAQGCCDGQT